MLTPGDAVSLGLLPEQLPLVNAILKVSYQEYVQLEREHWQQDRSQDGRLVTTITPFPELFEQFESHFWSKLDRVLGEQPQSRARDRLPIRPLPLDSNPTILDTVAPGFFGWGGEAVRIETWREGDTCYWTLAARGVSHTQSAPQPPAELARFWEPLGTSEPTAIEGFSDR
jgi:hypothetical protein